TCARARERVRGRARGHLAHHHAVAEALGPVVGEALALVHGARAVVEERGVLLADAAGVVREPSTRPPPAWAISSTASWRAAAARPPRRRPRSTRMQVMR